MTRPPEQKRPSMSCCEGIPSGAIEPDGTALLMCDDECRCYSCETQRGEE